MEKPQLSVFVITYNQAAFVKQTIDSILCQETSFDYELIVANDCSPDNTTEVVDSIITTHPKRNCIRYFEHKKNLGMYGNFMFTLNKCQGKYIAICEGDDYWTDALKLQKQVDFLEANPEYEVCFTNIRIVDENDTITKQALITDNRRTDYERKHLPIWAPTLTRVFRNRDFSTLPSAPGLDTVMLLWQSQFGKIKFLNEITGSYRKHAGGIYSAQTEGKRKEQIILTDIISLGLIDSYLYSKYFGILLKKLVELRFIDKALFKINKVRVKKAFEDFKNEMTWFLRLKIRFSFLLIALPFTKRVKKVEVYLLRVLNRLFIY
ncbi:glycosyltransferase [Xanthomarina sp. F1114]|uniref:glycosyltransferase family 2 protein n=1 Tax=Xanthomarina sp. F1114 TaxID=2996019 RepID=UPI00225DE382|nr:glycosyltransferase [Xanthomarina sp. F1114]MCX7549059.1 glycosyltransferase [Xanthomarina sp. F1114]